MQKDGAPLVLCGDLNVAHTDRDLHPKERKPGVIGQRPDERALFDRLLETGWWTSGGASTPDDEKMFTLVGAVAGHAEKEHRMADRLRAGDAVARVEGDELPCAG